MKPDPSGMRVTMYHALPTTTTLAAKWDGRVVGTISLVREGVFGFPLQTIFDLSELRAQGGNIAEVSALAVHPDFRKTGGAILFPLMKFMYEYATKYFDTRHLVIAVNPDKIELYESLLLFRRLQELPVQGYDFANGAPAVGATLDLADAPERMQQIYGKRPARRNLHDFFVQRVLPNIQLPRRRYYTTNDPVMTPDVLDHFFNRATQGFSALDERRRRLLRSIYTTPAYAEVLPAVETQPPQTVEPAAVRRHQRYSLRCPARMQTTIAGLDDLGPAADAPSLNVIEVSMAGFQAESQFALPLHEEQEFTVTLGNGVESTVRARPVRRNRTEHGEFYGFELTSPADRTWTACVHALELGHTADDLMREPESVY